MLSFSLLVIAPMKELNSIFAAMDAMDVPAVGVNAMCMFNGGICNVIRIIHDCTGTIPPSHERIIETQQIFQCAGCRAHASLER